MTVKPLRPKEVPKCEISGLISYNLLESVPISFLTTVSPFAQTMWKSLCIYCKEHCIAYKIRLCIDGKQIESRHEKEYLIDYGGLPN